MSGLFGKREPRGFQLKPRYYDPEQEKREMILNELKEKNGIPVESKTAPGRGLYKGMFQEQRTKKADANMRKMLRFVVWIFALLIITYLLAENALVN